MNPLISKFCTSDPFEMRIINILNNKKIKFIHESEKEYNNILMKKNIINRKLDFYLPDYDIFIEIKAFNCPRGINQLIEFHQENVIYISGENSIKFFEMIINDYYAN